MTAIGYTNGDPRKLDKAGDAMTGDLVLAAEPTSDIEAATKSYVDAQPGFLVLAPGEPVPDGTPPGTLIFRST